MEFVSTKSK